MGVRVVSMALIWSHNLGGGEFICQVRHLPILADMAFLDSIFSMVVMRSWMECITTYIKQIL